MTWSMMVEEGKTKMAINGCEYRLELPLGNRQGGGWRWWMAR